MSSDEEFDNALSTLVSGMTSDKVDTTTTESAAQTIQSRIGAVAKSAGQSISQFYHDLMLNPSNPIMSAVLSAAAESSTFSEIAATSFYLGQALLHIANPVVISRTEREAMRADLEAKEAEMAAAVAQAKQNHEELKKFLEDLQSRHRRFGWTVLIVEEAPADMDGSAGGE